MARQGVTAAYGVRRQGVVDTEIAGIAMECRNDLLEAAVVLDALALCHGHGSSLPRPCQETSTPFPGTWSCAPMPPTSPVNSPATTGSTGTA
ncbi:MULTISPECIES: hypothetical protein [Streptomyces]|uniref:hypothetical protein n=1 Tax=Streptomyces TaxID=1883 RepID=UPI0004BE1F10|nr:hypothetical protein [Streptomyces griseolus]